MTSGFSASMASELFRIEGADMKRAVPVLLLVLAACATPETQRPAVPSQATDEEARIQLALALNRRMDTRDQLWRVNYRLGAAAADLCGDHVVRVTGMLVQTIAAYGEQYRAAALARYPSLGAAPSVSNVAPGSAAEAAGLKTNDVITAINGEPIPAGDKPLDGYHALLRKASNGPVRFTIERGSTASEVTVEPRPYCNYRAYLVADKSEVNASTDGNVIQVYRGMMDFVRSDDELALVLGHEMAHDVGGHLAAKRKNAVVGAVFDVSLGATTGMVGNTFSNMGGRLSAGAYSQEFEAEADYVGLYIMARAGYDFHDAVNFWRRMAVNSPGAITMASDHPTTSERFVALQAAIKEIDAKLAQGQPLLPNEQGAATAAKE
jgi:beta-barrel assembly-enhancing protease